MRETIHKFINTLGIHYGWREIQFTWPAFLTYHLVLALWIGFVYAVVT